MNWTELVTAVNGEDVFIAWPRESRVSIVHYLHDVIVNSALSSSKYWQSINADMFPPQPRSVFCVLVLSLSQLSCLSLQACSPFPKLSFLASVCSLGYTSQPVPKHHWVLFVVGLRTIFFFLESAGLTLSVLMGTPVRRTIKQSKRASR